MAKKTGAKKKAPKVSELSLMAQCALFILHWERNRPEPVSTTEYSHRMGVTHDAAKAAFTELYERGFVDASPAQEYQV